MRAGIGSRLTAFHLDTVIGVMLAAMAAAAAVTAGVVRLGGLPPRRPHRVKTLLSPFNVLLLTVIALSTSASVAAQELGPSQIARRTVENDLSVRQAELSLEATRRSYLSARASSGPALTLTGPMSGSTLYSVNTTLGEESSSQSVGLELAYAQATPAGGSIGASIENTLSVAGAGDASTYTQNPRFGFSYRMPLFVDSKLVNSTLTGSSYRRSELEYQRAEDRALDGRNQAVVAALGLYVEVVQVRNTIAVLEEEIALERENLAELRITQEQGRTALSDVWAAEIALQAKQDALFERTQTLRLRERSLGARIGEGDSVGAEELSTTIPSIDVNEEEVRPMAMSHQLEDEEIDLDVAELNATLAMRQFGATLGFSLSASPSHPSGFSGASVGESFSELTGDDTSISVGAGLSLSVPLYRSGKKEHESALGATQVRRAEISVEQRHSEVWATLDQLFLSAELLAERLAYLSRNIELDTRRLDEARQLFELQTVTEADVRTAALQLERRQNEAWKAEADLMITRLQILSLAGVDIVGVLTRG